MKRLISLLPRFSNATVFFVAGEGFDINQILNLLAIRDKLRTYELDVTLRSVEHPEQCEVLAVNEPLTIYLYVETIFSKNVINVRVPGYGDEEEMNFVEVLEVSDVFEPEETQALLRVADPNDKLHQLHLHQLWELQEKHHSLVVDALIVNKLLERYLHMDYFLRHILHFAQPNIHSLYLTCVDFLNRNRHPLGKKAKKDKVPQNVTGKVICVPHEGDYPMNHHESFALYPKAHYLINCWEDGRLQIVSNDEHDDRHRHLDQVYQIVMDKFRERLQKKIIPLSVVKWVGDQMHMTIFHRVLQLHNTLFFGKRDTLQAIKEDPDAYDQPWEKLTADQASKLDKVGINLWELFHLTDHKTADEVRLYCIPFYGRENRPGKVHQLLLTTKAKKLSDMIRKAFVAHLNIY